MDDAWNAVIVVAMQKWPDNSNLTKSGCLCTSFIVKDSRTAYADKLSTICALEVLELLLDRMKRFSEKNEPLVASTAMEAIGSIFSINYDVDKKDLRDFSGFDAVISVMKKYPNHRNLQWAGSRLLSSSSFNTTAAIGRITNAGARSAAAKAIATFHDPACTESVAIQKFCLTVLERIINPRTRS
jgi:hypothetical protein